jgi:hypothetical protein
MLRNFESELRKKDWRTIRDGIEVKPCRVPEQDDNGATRESEIDPTVSDPSRRELFNLCRS